MPERARKHFQDELAELEQQTLGALDMVVGQLDNAMEALIRHDVELSHLVVADDDRLDGRYLEVHQGVLGLIARQAPVAGDLRLAAALLHVIRHAERMGDHCVNIAKLVPLDDPQPRTDDLLLEKLARMGQHARLQVVQARRCFADRNVQMALDLVRLDDEIDRLNRECFDRVVEISDDLELREWGMHMMLAARNIERIGDYAVDVGEQTAFVVTGLFQEFQDASHPELSPQVDSDA